MVKIEFDLAKRDKTLAERGLNFADADQVFAGEHFTDQDLRQNHPEARYITIGTLNGRIVIVVWCQRSDAHRIISMRKANERECRIFESRRMGG